MVYVGDLSIVFMRLKNHCSHHCEGTSHLQLMVFHIFSIYFPHIFPNPLCFPHIFLWISHDFLPTSRFALPRGRHGSSASARNAISASFLSKHRAVATTARWVAKARSCQRPAAWTRKKMGSLWEITIFRCIYIYINMYISIYIYIYISITCLYI